VGDGCGFRKKKHKKKQEYRKQYTMAGVEKWKRIKQDDK
jgi:hypothetical protein